MQTFLIGLWRGVGIPGLGLLLLYLSSANHLAGLGLSATIVGFITFAASSLEVIIEKKTGNAVFGAVRSR